MLNCELLQYRSGNGRIVPKFVEMQPAALTLCGTLLSIYSEAVGKQLTRAAVAEEVEPFIKSSTSGKLAAGLNKLILDHCVFTSAAGESNAAECREKIFKIAAEILKNPPEDPAIYHQMVRQKIGNAQAFPSDIYNDLPEFDRLTAAVHWSAEQLLNRYNTALIQGLLIYSDNIEVMVSDTQVMVLRKFMRRLKFYRLLALVKKESAGEIKLNLSGPGAVFGENRKYGLQLAAFFPVILLLKNWKIRAVIKLPGKKEAVLSLSSEKCSLKSYFQHWASCVPEEVALFIKSFRQECTQWVEAPEAPLPRIANLGAFFPDFSFACSSDPDKIVHVELFHRYYTHALDERLAFLQKNPHFPLIVGIDRAILGKGGEKEFLSKYSNLEEHLFFFSNYPGVDRVRKMLNKFYCLQDNLL